MKVVIIEDEMPAARKLQKMLSDISPDIECMAHLSSVWQSVQWFQTHELPDLVFMDIELSDGISLDLIKKVNISCPIIFITAFDEYWQEAFEHNSIDYLLKPLKKERLEISLNKLDGLKQHFAQRYNNLVAYKNEPRTFKGRFLIRRGKEFISLRSEDIAFFYATHKLVCVVDKKGTKNILDSSVTEIETHLDPAVFFRANRKFLINRSAITRISLLPHSKLSIETTPDPPEKVIVSSENSAQFKIWMG